MKGVLHLLSRAPVLGVLLFLSVCVSGDVPSPGNATTSPRQNASRTDLTNVSSSVSETTSLMGTITNPQVHSSQYTASSSGPEITSMPVATRINLKTTTKTTTATTTPMSANIFANKACAPALMVSGGLILVCFVFLTSTLLLAWKVCQLNRRIKTLGSNDDLVSNCEYYVGTAKKNKSKSETGAKETTLLMADLQQTQEEKKNGAAKEDGKKVNEDGQKEEEKKAGDAAPSDEASESNATEKTENPSSSKPEEAVADSKSPDAAAASPSKGKEEAKDGP